MPVLPWEPVSASTVGRTRSATSRASRAERGHDVGDDDRRDLGRAGAEHRDGAALHRGGGEVVAVDPLPRDRHEQPARRRARGGRRNAVAGHGDRPGRRATSPPTTSAISASVIAITASQPPAPRARRRGRRREAPRRRPPGRSRDPCRRRARRRRRGRGRGPRGWLPVGRRPRCTSAVPSRVPARISARMAAGSSPRGLSSVTTRTSASRRGDLAHDRALAGVALAAGAEDHDEAAVGQRAQGREGGGDGVGLVRVVDDDGEVLALRRPARAGRARHRPRPSRGRRRRGRTPPSAQAARAASALATLKSPGSGQPASTRTPPGPATTNVEPGRRHLDVLGPPVGVAARGREGLERDVAALEQAPAVLVVDVDQAADAPLGGEQRRLGLEVVLDVGVEVEVVAAQVGEDRDVEDDAVDATLHERVAGDLHGAGGDATLLHHREQRVQVRRLGRGQRRLDLLGVHPRADGADHCRPHPRALEGALGETRGGRLALGAGHAEHPQRPRGFAVHVRREAAEQGPRSVDLEHRQSARGPGCPGAVGQHGDRTGVDRGLPRSPCRAYGCRTGPRRRHRAAPAARRG